MEMLDFLSLVTPDEGYRYVTLIEQKVDSKQKFNQVSNVPYATLEEGVALIKEAEQRPTYNIYFSCASFKEEEYRDAKGKRKTRTADNAIFARAIWRDLDVGLNDDGKPKPDAYESQGEAVQAIADMCLATSIPLPLIVSSGKGIHAYWPFNRNVPKDEWLRIAGMAQQVFREFGLKSDSSRDTDIASVLRPIGTKNKGKYIGGEVTSVELLHDIERPINPDDFIAVLSPHIHADSLAVVPSYMQGAGSNTGVLARQKQEYPPSFAKIIATKCMQIAHFKETGGSNYQTWWLSVGLCKHTVEGEKIAHQWAAKHAEYSEGETQKKLDSWEKGPPTCDSYADADGLCSACEFRGKVKSPISLGYEEVAAPQEVVVAEADEEHDEEKIVLPQPFQYYNGSIVQRVVVENQVVLQKVTNTLFWFVGRHWMTSGEMVYSVVCRVRQNADGRWQYRNFDLPSGTIGRGGGDLYELLGQNEIYAVADKGAKSRMDTLVAAMAEQLRQREEETRAYRVYGWQEDGGFLLGDQRVMDGAVTKVKVAGDSAPSFLPAFSKNAGTAEEWVEIVEAMYAHPGHAAFQTIVLFGIGSPLLRFYQMPTGCLVNMVGERGTGKTTAARVGLSAYGDPNGLMTELRSTTELALYNRLATMHSIPISVDELTNIEPIKASNMIYSIMNGQPRDGMKSDGKRRDQLLPWQTVTFGAANGSIVDLLAAFRGNASAEISRLIELDWRKVHTIERRDMDVLLEALRGHYGSIGLRFVSWVNQNEKKCERTLLKMREFIEDELDIDKENRFWSAHIAVPLATKMILQDMNLLNGFDFDPILELCMSTIREHKSSMAAATMDNKEAFHAMLTFLSDKIISTRTLKDGRLATPDGVIMNGEPVGRAILEENDLYLSVAAVREWCSLKRMSYKAMRKELLELEILRGDSRFYLGRGTTRITGQTFCWHLNLNRVLGFSHTTADIAEAGHLRLVKPT